MKVLLAGATGAIGVPLTRLLVAAGHDVVALTRNPAVHERLRQLGATPLTADVLDRDALLAAVAGVRADAVVHELTALKKPPMFHRSMRRTNRLRVDGTANLLAAAEVVGAQRFVTQSMVFGYGYGDWRGHVLTEDDPFAPAGRGRFEEPVAALRVAEDSVLRSDLVEGVALRYGLFYGVGAGDDLLVRMLRRRQVPVLRESGPLSWVYVDDAAAATVAALERGVAGEAYNVVDDQPVSWTDLVRAFAAAVGAPRPPTLPRWLLGVAPYAKTMMIGGLTASNLKARHKLGWTPEVPTYREGVARVAAHHAR